MGNPIFRFTLTYEPETLPPLANWTEQAGVGTAWTTGSAPTVTTSTESKYLYIPFPTVPGSNYAITVNYTLSGSFGIAVLSTGFLNNSLTEEDEDEDNSISGGIKTETFNILSTSNSSYLYLKFESSLGGSLTVVINSISIEGSSLEISEPGGWIDAKLRLERHEEFHSLIEYFKGSFTFYGNNGVDNGGLDYIRGLERALGLDVTILITVVVSFDSGKTYEDIFSGQLDLSAISEEYNNQADIPIIRDDFWSKFISRKETPVDLQAVTDLDSATIVPVDPVTLNLPTQKIRYNGEYNWTDSITYPGEAFMFNLLLNWDEIISDDIKIFSLIRAGIPEEDIQIFGLVEAPYDGYYTFDIKVVSAKYEPGVPRWFGDQFSNFLRIQKTNSTAYQEGTNVLETVGADSYNTSSIVTTLRLLKGEQVSITLRRLNATDNVTVFGERRLNWKTDCDLATTQAIVLSGEQTIDGTLTSASRVLVKDQGNSEQNGIYVSAAGAWSRATDMDQASEFTNAAVYITGGTNNLDAAFLQTEQVGTVGSDAVLFTTQEPSDERFRPYTGTAVENYLLITADTTFPSSQASSFLLHDTFAGILKAHGLGESNPFYSLLLGSELTNARTYLQDGCAWRYTLLKGLQARGYTLDEKPFFLSFDQCWKGANPILNLGLTYDILEADNGEEPVTDFPDLTDFTNSGSGDSWSISTTPSVNVVSGASAALRSPSYSFDTGYRYVVSVDYTKVYNSGSGIVHQMELRVTNASNSPLYTELIDTTTGSDSGTIVLDFTVDTIYMDRIAIDVDDSSDVTVTVQNLSVVRFPSDIQQLLLNPDFTTSSNWANEDSGTNWVVGSGDANVTLASGGSKSLVQRFQDTGAGNYNIISRRVSTNFNIGVDSVNFGVTAYDADDNQISGFVEFVSGNNTVDNDHSFTSSVPIVKIVMFATINSGSDVDISASYLYLFGPSGSVVNVAQRIIRIEEKAFFYDPDMSMNISNVLDITREYDNDLIFNKVEVGYTNWQSEDISGIDDPQTKHTYATRFKKIGKPLTLYSEFVAASLALETTRRQTIEKSKDYKFDNSTFIVAINPDDVSPDSYVPELDENFDSVTNLLNADTRYNLRITPARNLLRWFNYINGALQNYLSSFYKFVGGEGNYDMISQMHISAGTPDLDCLNESYDDQPFSEKQDIQVSNEYLHLPLLYTININLSWDEYEVIRNNRTKAIGISQTDANHAPFFIKELEYELCASKCTIKAWPLSYFDIRQTDFVPTRTEPITGCGFGEMDRITSDGEGRVTSDGECRVTI